MTEMLWCMVAYMVAGVIHGILIYEESDTAGMVFLELFLWPLPVLCMAIVFVEAAVVWAVDNLLALVGWEEQE